MPLCAVCKAEHRNERLPGEGPSLPPHGMEWGETCGWCGRTAEVIIRGQ